MESILVTGGAGYIGSHTVLSLLNNGFSPVVLDNLSNSSDESLKRIEALTGKNIIFKKGDICDTDLLNSIFQNHKINCILHFAAFKAVGESVEKPLDYYKNNVSGLIELLNVSQKHKINKFIFSSSCTVYGEPQKVPLDESHETGNTSSPYGNTKFLCEQIIQNLSSSKNNFKHCILRYFNPIGADKSGEIGEDPLGIPDNLLPYICKVAVGSLDSLKIFGNDYPTKDGTAIRDYIHVSDLAEAHVCALKFLNKQNENLVCNLGTGNGYSVLDIVNTFQQANSLKIPFSFAPKRKGDVVEAWSNPSLAKEKLKWHAKLSLKQMLEDSWNWQKKNPKGYN